MNMDDLNRKDELALFACLEFVNEILDGDLPIVDVFKERYGTFTVEAVRELKHKAMNS